MTATEMEFSAEVFCERCGVAQTTTMDDLRFGFCGNYTAVTFHYNTLYMFGVYKDKDMAKFNMKKSIPLSKCKKCKVYRPISSKILIPELVENTVLAQTDSFIVPCLECENYISFDSGHDRGCICLMPFLPWSDLYLVCPNGHRFYFRDSYLPKVIKTRLGL